MPSLKLPLWKADRSTMRKNFLGWCGLGIKPYRALVDAHWVGCHWQPFLPGCTCSLHLDSALQIAGYSVGHQLLRRVKPNLKS